MLTNRNDGDTLNPNPDPKGHSGPRDAENPGYETTDVNVSGVAVFLAGLMGFLLVFFGFCFVMGRVINSAFEKADGPSDKWHQTPRMAGDTAPGGKRQDLTSNPVMQQKQLQQMTANFPTPRLDVDDGNQATADLHAKEDLLLNNYSEVAGESGTVRIPITRAMELIAQRGLPVHAETGAPEQLAGDSKPEISAPLTTGFARTGYELTVIEAREQKMSYGKAEGATHAELTPAKPHAGQ
jgi:hypothetical protein